MKIIEILSMFLPDIYNPLGVRILASIALCQCVGFTLLFSGLIDFNKLNSGVKKHDWLRKRI